MSLTGIGQERSPATIEKGENIIYGEANSSDRSTDEFTWTQEEETLVRRKLDRVIVPLTTFLYLLCFLDRVNVGNARIQGMGKDLHLVGVRFNWVTSIFYIVYMFVEVPSNILLKRIGPKYYLPLLVVGFGFVSLCTAFVHSFQGLLAARAMLGMFEGGVMPGLAFFITCFYKRNELLFRIGIYVSAASMAGAFGGLLATILARIPPWGISSMVIHTWRNIFFFEGLFTMLVGLGAPFLMPRSPQECWFLNERERMIAMQRLVLKGGGAEDEKVEVHHVKRAVMNVTNYFCALGFFFINITVQGISLFMPTILNDLGWTATKAQLYSVPPYVCACLVAVGIAFISDKTNRRGIYLAIFTLPAIAGFAIMRWASNPDVRYGGIFLITLGAFPGGPGFLAWSANNAAGPAVRSVSTAYVVTLGTAGGILATWTYTSKDAPKYPTGHTINLCGQICVLILACGGIAYCKWENRQRDLGKRDHRVNGLSEAQIRGLGYRHPEFSTQWGDEGKGKLADILAHESQICCRAQGGNNAGHTIVANGVTYDFHILPSGLVNPNCVNLIGSGCVVHVPSFFKELEALEKHGLKTEGRIFISDRAHVVFDVHQLVDGLEEVELGGGFIGTTRKGIGPTYSTKMTRSGLRMCDLFDEHIFEQKLRRLAMGYQKRFGDLLKYDPEEEIAKFKVLRERLAPYIVDQIPLLASAKEKNTKILVEGANALMLDIDYGTYPFVTSSNTGLGGVITGLSLGWRSLKEVIGVVKAYTTRVGSGPFPTEQLNELGEKLQSVGHEVGVTTGRKRRCGWLDLVVVKHSHACNDYTAINLTKLDVLDDFDELKIATSYSINGQPLEGFPSNPDVLSQVEVHYETLPGWKKPTTGAKSYYDLPNQARTYIEYIEKFIGVKVKWIGVGPARDHMISRSS
ncbi:uncharacterized protein K460DRAFT_378875 [Cucurbitaria berberidis CBS 394.84]|uniref:Adenylosuccinate synthetase n=1 Tax=Cucurbitaria berberidis CBS 394.84 TaxID=1168544 RepID=A0A9P4GEL0_9PLEO|nr:uncharacterized protein K460DRAFT_378875 [Cucurbitaria berberidis CBS 394.84]KAF1843819.1 hypothetical protein K460DRAFT_378875 [Cucurbitaria berberidis CBS 394.84]